LLGLYHHLPDLKTVTLVILFFSVLHCKAQSIFFRTYGGTNKEEGRSLAQCSDGGFIIGADITLIPPAPDSCNILVVRTNSFGDTLWTRIINSGENDFCEKVIQTSDLGFAVLINRVNSSNNSKIMLVKLNSTGVIQWHKTFLNSVYGLTGYSLIEKMQGGYMICGGKTYSEGLLINTNPVGDTLWTKIYGHTTSFWDIPFQDIKQLSDSTFVILSANYNINIFYPRMLRIDSSGNIMYAKEYIDGSLDDGISVCFANMQVNNQFAFAGNSRTNQYNRFIIKVDSLFNIQWQQKYSVSTANIISSIVQTQDSGFVFIAGPDYSLSAHYCLMIKTNSSGVVLWAKEFQYASFSEFQYSSYHLPHYSLVSTLDNGIAFCGFFMDTISFNNKDLALIKVDANGNVPCDGINVSILNSAISFYPPGSITYVITWETMQGSSTLTIQGGLPTNNLCFTTEATKDYLEQSSDFMIFPNPVRSELIIDAELKIEIIEVYDVMGKICLRSDLPHRTINVSSLTAGIYFVTVTDKNGNKTSKKFVKM
jgi:hypothetical protein